MLLINLQDRLVWKTLFRVLGRIIGRFLQQAENVMGQEFPCKYLPCSAPRTALLSSTAIALGYPQHLCLWEHTRPVLLGRGTSISGVYSLLCPQCQHISPGEIPQGKTITRLIK